MNTRSAGRRDRARKVSPDQALKDYRQYVRRRLNSLLPIFAHASIGNFTKDVKIPNKDDEFTELYVGVQVMLEVIREQLTQLKEELKLERKQEQRVIQEKAQAESLLASIGEGVVAIDRNGKTLLYNTAAEIMLGYRAKDVIGKSWLRINDIVDRDGFPISVARRPVKRVLETGRKVTGKYRFIRKDKLIFPAAVTASPVKYKGKTLGAIKVFRDITREEEVDRAKTEFVSLASHQLRTPLATINWFTEQLLGGARGRMNPEQQAYVEEVAHSNRRMIDLVNALLNVSRIELGTFSIDPHPTNLWNITKSVLKEHRLQIERKHLNLQLQYDRRLPEVNVDAKLIRIVLQNLLSNAVKYTPERGTIRFSLERRRSTVVILVSDTGIGIPGNFKARVFKKLFRADNAVEVDPDGTGLGLYIAKAIIERARGRIDFVSTPGAGTTFSVILPLAGMERQKGTRPLI